MKIILLVAGKTTERYIEEGIEDYTARIRKFNSFEVVTQKEIRNFGSMPAAMVMEKEGNRMIDYFSPDDYVVLLDERGKDYRSTQFASWLEDKLILPKKRIVFVAGGPWGFSDAVYRRADSTLSLSNLTFSHQLVRLLFLEQLYRAFTIIKGIPYHHE